MNPNMYVTFSYMNSRIGLNADDSNDNNDGEESDAICDMSI